MKKTAFYDHHLSLHAKMVSFSDYLMPLHYGSILDEHRHVRSGCGLFDLSHMGRCDVFGKEALSLLDFLSTNTIKGKKVGTATYTVWCNALGYCLEDLIIYRTEEERFSLIFNACNKESILQHLGSFAQEYAVTIEPRFEEGILALQGPQALDCVERLFPEIASMQPMQCVSLDRLLLATTGYTGLGGCEIAAPIEQLLGIWEALFKQNPQLRPIGLGARDTLRLEKGYALYGHELSPSILSIESVAGWTVKLQKKAFLGQRALKEKERHRYCLALVVLDRGIAREKAKIFYRGEEVGEVTSGSYSPTLEKGIALGLAVKSFSVEDVVEVEGHGQLLHAQVVNLPFVT